MQFIEDVPVVPGPLLQHLESGAIVLFLNQERDVALARYRHFRHCCLLFPKRSKWHGIVHLY